MCCARELDGRARQHGKKLQHLRFKYKEVGTVLGGQQRWKNIFLGPSKWDDDGLLLRHGRKRKEGHAPSPIFQRRTGRGKAIQPAIRGRREDLVGRIRFYLLPKKGRSVGGYRL